MSSIGRPIPLLILLAIVPAVEAVVIHPDGTAETYDDYWDALRNGEWEGQVLASRVTRFEIRVPSEKAGRDLVAAGTLTHEVVREFESGYLSFHYRVNGGPVTADNMDFEGLSMRGFGTWFTDLRSDRTHESHSISRYADGDGLSYWDEHCDHWIIVRTNAPDFAERGSFSYSVDWDGWREDGFARIDTFRPVPEPTAGLVALMGSAALMVRRRRRSACAPPPGAGR